MPSKKSAKKSKKSNTLLYVLIGILICCIVGGYFVYRHYHKAVASTTTSSSSRNIYSPPVTNSNVPGGNEKSTSQGSGIYSSKGSAPSSPSLSSTVQPAAPVGDFVSDHRPNLGGKPAPNTETSTCTTTPGATCQIKFTMGSIVKSLPKETTDGNGNASWSWTLQSVGLSQGTWQVTAIAANGSKIATATDVNKLVVEP